MMVSKKIPTYQIVALVCLILLLVSSAKAQRFLVLDRYGKKRIKLFEGEQIYFKQTNNRILYRAHILELKDTSLVLAGSQHELSLNQIAAVYFPRKITVFRSGFNYLGSGFLFAGLIHPTIADAQYEARESLIAGSSLLILSQVIRLFKWKKFSINARSRIRILDTSFVQSK